MKRVLCFGNELHGDDGFGPAVGRCLAAMALPRECAGIEVIEAGTRGLDAMALLEGCTVAVLVDAAAPAGHPGRLDEPGAEMLACEDTRAGHGQGLGYALQGWLQAAAHPRPRLHVLTAEMSAWRAFSPGLSPAVAASVVPAAARVRQWLLAAADAEAAGGAW